MDVVTGLLRGLQRLPAAFGSNAAGNVAIIFGLAFIPIIGFVGAAVDYSRANVVRTQMQNALDSTTLMLAKDPSLSSYTSAQLQQKASGYFNALMTDSYAKNVQVGAPVVDQQASTVTATASSTVPTVIMRILPFNIANINMSISSTVAWGMTRLRVALVLDNTGSMAQSGKLPALQTATKNLLNQLKSAAAQNGDVYVSIIPFVKDVNVNPADYSQIWVQWDDGTDTSWDGANGTCSKSGYSPRSVCQAQGTCSKSHTSQSKCTANGATWTPATWTPDKHSTWNGCVMDCGDSTGPDAGNYDTNVAPPSASTLATLLPAEQYSTCPQAAMGLSYDWTTMSTLVDNMAAGGTTNQAIGLALGWMSLVGGGPFTAPPMDLNYKYTQVIVLLTDGLNTQDRWYGDGSNVSTQVDARQQITCNNINAAGITLYTVQVNTGGDPTSTLLQNCAGSPGKYPDPSKFFLLTSASEIVTIFNQIGTNLSQLRIAK
jgi:Flp pilus assembly protein TadG